MQASFEKIFQKINVDMVALMQSLEHLSEEQLNAAMQKNKWSIAQTMYHVNESMVKTLRYVNKKIQYPETIKKTNFYTSIKSFLLNFILHTNIKMKAPKGVVTYIPEHIILETIQTQSVKNISNLQTLLELFPAELMNRNVFKHPVAGRITMYQTLQFMHEHLMHHARQIAAYLNKYKAV